MYLRSGEQLVSRYLTSLQGSALMQPLLHIELQIVPLLHQSATVAGILQLPMHLPHAADMTRLHQLIDLTANPAVVVDDPMLTRGTTSLDLNFVLIFHFLIS